MSQYNQKNLYNEEYKENREYIEREKFKEPLEKNERKGSGLKWKNQRY